MKNLAAYLDDFIEEQDDKYFENCKTKKIPSKKNIKKDFLSEGYKDKKNKKDKHRRDY